MIIPRPAPRVHRRLAAVLAAFVVGILAILVLGTPAHAAVDEEQTQDGTVELALTLGSHGAMAAGSSLSATATIENGVGEQLSTGVLAVELGRTPLADSTAVQAWVEEGTAPDAFDQVYSAPTAAVPAQDDITAAVFVAAEDLQDLTPGVYPIRASLSSVEGSESGTLWNLSARSLLTVRTGAPAQVSVLVPITATPSSGVLLSSSELAELTADGGALDAQLDGVAGTSAVLAVDPAIIAAIRVLGTAAPESASAWLERLEILPNERFALQFGDADASAQAQAGLDGLLAPTTLDPLIDAENLVAEPTPSPSPTEETTPLPSVEELTAIDGSLPGVLWPRGQVTAADLSAFSGFLGTDAVTVLPRASVSAAGANAVIGESRVLVLDDELSGLLSTAAATTSPTERAALLAQATADLSFSGRPASGVLVGLERDETRTADALREAIGVVAAQPLDALRSTTPVSGTISSEADPSRAAAVTQLLDDESRLAAFATILDDPQVLLTPERIRILRLLAVGAAEDAFTSTVAAHRTDTVDTLNAVDIQPYTGPIQLISANVALPVWIRNDLPWPVSLTLEVRPSDPRIDIEPYTEVEATASGNTRIQLPVAARVASGELDVRFSLTSPTGVPIGLPQSADVTVRAEWENIGLGVLGGIIVLLLGFGIVRTIRRRRREPQHADASVLAEPTSPQLAEPTSPQLAELVEANPSERASTSSASSEAGSDDASEEGER
ncbi:DUF6049 family protein [Microbacterium sp. NPDC055903]